jgi:hypothetical protein
LYSNQTGAVASSHPDKRPSTLTPDTEPFTDTAFVSRLQKLISMLGSEQPGEAEAARRKLLDHLGHHRLSLTDVAMRLREGAPRTASFTQGAREISLERQLSIARAARQEAEADAQNAQRRAADMQFALQQAAFDVGRALQGQARARTLAAIGWAAAAGALLVAVALQLRLPPDHAPALAEQTATITAKSAMLGPVSPGAGDPSMRLAPGEHYGVALVQDLPVRMNPNDDAEVRAFLNRGMRVVIEQQVRVGLQTWLLIRSVTGSGWVRGGDVLH